MRLAENAGAGEHPPIGRDDMYAKSSVHSSPTSTNSGRIIRRPRKRSTNELRSGSSTPTGGARRLAWWQDTRRSYREADRKHTSRGGCGQCLRRDERANPAPRMASTRPSPNITGAWWSSRLLTEPQAPPRNENGAIRSETMSMNRTADVTTHGICAQFRRYAGAPIIAPVTPPSTYNSAACT